MPLASLIAIAALVLAACGHTNRLSEYPVLDNIALYETRVSPKALDAEIWIAPPPTDTAQPREVGWMLEIARTAAEVIAEAEASRKLQEAIVPEELALAAGRGFQNAAETYLRLRSVRSLEDDPPFLVETILEEFKLVSSGFGVKAEIAVRSRILHRPTAQIVWEKREKSSVPLQRTMPAGLTPGAATVASILNAGRLLSLEPAEIRRILSYAAQRAGEQLGEALRRDVVKLPRKGA
jgi:hypothetical protein